VTDITIQNQDVRLAASVYGQLEKPAILLLHGISMSRDAWFEVAQKLSDQYLVYTLDFRGHGHSDHTKRYVLSDYISDARATLAAIGKPAIVVGHSLGGCVAGVLAQDGDSNIRAVCMVDPPWYLGQPGEWQKSVFRQLFAFISGQQRKWQNERAPLSNYLQFVSAAPSPMGGITSDHVNFRQLLCHASSLQRQDPRCWDNVIETASLFSVIDTTRPFKCPMMIIQADPACGAALLEGHDRRLSETNPQAEIIRYERCGHTPQRTKGFEQRFLQDLERFLLRHA
jgi:pimeloyl-ACP methyl ester carboxylesterase